MEYFVYVIRSSTKNWFYVGFTNNVDTRLNQHNLGKVSSTKAYKPFYLIFVQVVNSRIQARDFEKYIKVKFNKEALLDVISPMWWNWQTRTL